MSAILALRTSASSGDSWRQKRNDDDGGAQYVPKRRHGRSSKRSEPMPEKPQSRTCAAASSSCFGTSLSVSIA